MRVVSWADEIALILCPQPVAVASDGIVHGVGNGVNGTYSGFTFENSICTGHP